MRPNMHTADSPETSAVVPVPNAESVEIRKNHANMVKFRHSSDDDFKTVVGHFGLMCERTEEKVAQSWERWEEKGVQSRHHILLPM